MFLENISLRDLPIAKAPPPQPEGWGMEISFDAPAWELGAAAN